MKKMRFAKIAAASLLTASALSFAAVYPENAVFAFEKPHNEAIVSFESEDAFSAGKKLYESGVISLPLVYGAYCRIKGDVRPTVPGEYALFSDMSYDEIRRAVCTAKERTAEVTVTVPEGSTSTDVIRLLTEAGIGTEEGFAEAMNSLDYDFDFVRALRSLPRETAEKRKVMLEGYLFPDTYFFSTDCTERQAVEKMLKNFDARFNERYRASCASQGFSIDEAITLASLVEKEARHREDFKKVASVFRNRLRSKRMTKLESDASVAYALERKITAKDLYTDSPYNTYKYKGLPPGAVCNPGKRAILAALEPADTEFLYFVSDGDGNMFYSKTKAEHDGYVNMIKNAN